MRMLVPKNRSRVLLHACIALSALLSAACAAASRPIANPAEVDVSEYARLFRAADEVLRKHGFAIERRDYRFGVVTTRGLAAPTLLEPWHDSNSTAGQAVESTINGQRRLVTISITPAAASTQPASTQPATAPAATQTAATAPATSNPGDESEEPAPGSGTYLLSVVVQVERSQFPDRRMSGSTRGSRVTQRLSETPAELQERGITGPYWLPIGRDEPLEQRLLGEIIRRSVTIGPR